MRRLNNHHLPLHDLEHTVDEGWENCSGSDPNNGLRQHDAQGFPMVNTDKFPDLKTLVDYSHSKNIKMGWWVSVRARVRV